MALTRKLLKALGIEDEKTEQIIEAHSETVDALKAQRDKAQEEAEAKAEAVGELEKQLDEAKADGADDGYKAKYEALNTEYETYKAEIEQRAAQETAQRLYREALKAAGVQDAHIDLIANDKTTDLAEFAIADGKYEDADAVATAIKEKYSAYIPQVGAQQGAQVATPPANDGGKSIEDMTQAEYIAWKSKKRGN